MFKRVLTFALIGALVVFGGMYLLQNPGKVRGFASRVLPSGSEVSTQSTSQVSPGPGLNLGFNLGIGRNPEMILAQAEAEALRAKIPSLVEEQEALTAHQREILLATLPDAIQSGRTEHQVHAELARIEEQVARAEAENVRQVAAVKLEARRARNRNLAIFGFFLALAIGISALIFFPSRAARTTAHALFGPVMQKVGSLTLVSSSPWDVLQGEMNPSIAFQDYDPGSAIQLPHRGRDALAIGEEHATASLSAAAARAGRPQAVAGRLAQIASTLRSGTKALPSGNEDK